MTTFCHGADIKRRPLRYFHAGLCRMMVLRAGIVTRGAAAGPREFLIPTSVLAMMLPIDFSGL